MRFNPYQFTLNGFSSAKKEASKKSYLEFLAAAKIEPPIEGLTEIIPFMEKNKGEPSEIMGARGIGKSYVIVPRIAYEIYLNKDISYIFGSKSISVLRKDQHIVERLFDANKVKYSGGFKSGITIDGSESDEPNILCLPVGSKGARGHHPTGIFGDDIVGMKDKYSEAERRRTQDCYEEFLDLTRNILLAGQPVSPLDLYEQQKGKIPRLAIPWGKVPSRDANLEVLRRTKSKNSILANYFLDVSQEKLGMVFVDAQVARGVPLLTQMDVCIDPSAGRGDYTAIVVGGLDNFGKYHALGFCYKLPYWELIKKIKDIATITNANRIFFELNGIGQGSVYTFGQHNISIIGYTTKSGKSGSTKHAKINSIGAAAKDVILYAPEALNGDDTEANDIFNSQVREYQFGVSHDDAPDALVSLMMNQGFLASSEFIKND